MKPPVVLPRFVSDEEIAHLISVADGLFQRSPVVCESNPAGCIDPIRTSETAFLPDDAVTRAVQRRAMTYARIGKCELLQVVRYGVGQEYKPHFDAFDMNTMEGRRELLNSGGQRAATIFAYLQPADAGGATVFPALGLSYRPRRGDALYWTNLLPGGATDPQSEHGGAPVERGIKYGLNVWLLTPVIGARDEVWGRLTGVGR